MEIGDLRFFEAVARLGKMNRAAAELNTVQSNVTVRIRALEEELGAVLFRRHSRGVALTDAGHRLLPYATKIVKLVEEARRAVEDDAVPRGSLTIGSLETTAACRLPQLIAEFGKAYPSVTFALRTGTNASLLDQVLHHRLDGAFVCAPSTHPDLKGDVVFREELVLATAPGVTSVENLIRTGVKILVKAPGCAYRARLETLLAKQGTREVAHLEFGTLEAIIGCVAAGLGLTLLPRSVLSGAEHAGRVSLHPIPPSDRFVETLFIRRADAYESAALQAFLSFAVERSARDRPLDDDRVSIIVRGGSGGPPDSTASPKIAADSPNQG